MLKINTNYHELLTNYHKYFIAVPGKFIPLPFIFFSIGISNEQQSNGAYSKVPEGRKTTDGGASPRQQCDNERSPEGTKEFLICCPLTCWTFCRPFRASFSRHVPYRGLAPPSVVSRAFGACLADSNRKQRDFGKTGVNAILLLLAPCSLPPKGSKASDTSVKGNSWIITWKLYVKDKHELP